MIKTFQATLSFQSSCNINWYKLLQPNQINLLKNFMMHQCRLQWTFKLTHSITMDTNTASTILQPVKIWGQNDQNDLNFSSKNHFHKIVSTINLGSQKIWNDSYWDTQEKAMVGCNINNIHLFFSWQYIYRVTCLSYSAKVCAFTVYILDRLASWIK